MSTHVEPLKIIDSCYADNDALRRILIDHSRAVADKALEIAAKHPELNIDTQFVEQAAMLHDIGVFLTNAPSICCYGTKPYICHGYLGADLLRSMGHDRHALVCERHSGAGISLQMIIDNDLPLPHRDMLPLSIEEKVICFADKLFSKTSLGNEKTVDKAIRSLSKYGVEGVERFKSWCEMFL